MTPRGGDHGGRRPTMSEAGPGVKKNIRFAIEDAALIEQQSAALGMTYAEMLMTALRHWLAAGHPGSPSVDGTD